MKKLALAFTAVLVIFGFGSGAAAQYPPATPTVSLSTPSAAAGTTVTLTIAGCLPNEAIQLNLNGVASTAAADAAGGAVVPTTAPATAGVYNGSMTCNGSTVNFQLTVTAGPVTQGGSTNGGGSLPDTGSDSTKTVLTLGIGSLLIGLGLFGTTQVRRRHTV